MQGLKYKGVGMDHIALSIPDAKSTGWSTETKPKQAQAWLRDLPYANTGEAARRVYQALYALNRTAIPAQDRFDILEMYIEPTYVVVDAFQAQFARFALPLAPKKKQLADFLAQMQMEMAYGYKAVIRDVLVARQRVRNEVLATALERAIRYLGEVLLRCYQVYMPHPSNVWRELHALYEFAERQGVHTEKVAPAHEEEGRSTISRRYKQILLLGLCGPYQLPPNECKQVYAFLELWADKALIMSDFNVTNSVGHFLIDLTVDAPPLVFPKDTKVEPSSRLRILNALGLASTTHAFITRLLKGETPKALDLGTECVGQACVDMLRRMVRFWGLTARRQFSRMKIEESLSLCVGINAVHFFASGQKPFAQHIDNHTAIDDARAVVPEDSDSIDVDLAASPVEPTSPRLADAILRAPETFRVDEWQARDESASGLALVRNGVGGGHVRIGDLVGVENEATSQWRIGVARWLKSPDTAELEMGVEMIAPSAEPVAVRMRGGSGERFVQALLTAPIPALRKPATLLVPRGLYQQGQGLDLLRDDQVKAVMPIQVIERTGAFEQVSFADMTVG